MASNRIKLAVNGACGRMGHMVLQAALEDGGFEIVAAVESPECPLIGADAGTAVGLKKLGVKVAEKLSEGADVLVDFSAPQASLARLTECLKTGTAMVVATTGFTPDQMHAIHSAAEVIPVLHSANMSLGVNYLMDLVAQAARTLGENYDVEIVEVHHRHKKDAPSGTSLALGRAVAEARGVSLDQKGVHGRKGIVGPRTEGEIGFHAVRGGDVVGDHTVIFAGPGERIEFVHRATSRETFARGALRAARFLAKKPAGFYTMKEVLGL